MITVAALPNLPGWLYVIRFLVGVLGSGRRTVLGRLADLDNSPETFRTENSAQPSCGAISVDRETVRGETP